MKNFNTLSEMFNEAQLYVENNTCSQVLWTQDLLNFGILFLDSEELFCISKKNAYQTLSEFSDPGHKLFQRLLDGDNMAIRAFLDALKDRKKNYQ